jgi:hypothetical protein
MWKLWTYYRVQSLDKMRKLTAVSVASHSDKLQKYGKLRFWGWISRTLSLLSRIWRGQQTVKKVISALSSLGAMGWRTHDPGDSLNGLRRSLYTSSPVISSIWFTFFKFRTKISSLGGDCMYVSSLLQMPQIPQASVSQTFFMWGPLLLVRMFYGPPYSCPLWKKIV